MILNLYGGRAGGGGGVGGRGMRLEGWGAEFLKVSLKKCSTLLTKNPDFRHCRHLGLTAEMDSEKKGSCFVSL